MRRSRQSRSWPPGRVESRPPHPMMLDDQARFRRDRDPIVMTSTRLSIRIDLASGDRIGPGKIALLEAIRATGSISGAARSLGMSYRRAWLLVEQINDALREPAVTAAMGGRHGGGASATAAG